MEYLKAANTNLEIFSPETQRELVTLDEQHSFMSNSSLNSVLFGQIDSFEEEDLISDRLKPRKQTNPQKIKIDRPISCSCVICEDSIQDVNKSKTSTPKVNNRNCIKSDTISEIVMDQRKQIAWLTSLNENLVAIIRDKTNQYNKLLNKLISAPENDSIKETTNMKATDITNRSLNT